MRIFFACLLFLFHIATAAFAQPFLPTVKKVLFLGNSITYAGQYIVDVETYCTLNYPGQKIEFINMGLPSETVSGLSEPGHAGGKFERPDLHERLDRVMNVIKPDLVFVCYGMNDGIYLPFDQQRFQKFKDGINWLHEKYAAQGIRIIHVTPPVYDETKGGKKGYARVLDKYSDWLLKQRKSEKWEVADLHYPMKKYLQNGITLAKDGIHPAELGHWIMAKSLLLYLGEKQIAPASEVLATIQHPKKEEVFRLVGQKQAFMKDAWLTAAGHKRPMKAGLPLEEAQAKAAEIDRQIEILINNKNTKEQE